MDGKGIQHRIQEDGTGGDVLDEVVLDVVRQTRDASRGHGRVVRVLLEDHVKFDRRGVGEEVSSPRRDVRVDAIDVVRGCQIADGGDDAGAEGCIFDRVFGVEVFSGFRVEGEGYGRLDDDFGRAGRRGDGRGRRRRAPRPTQGRGSEGRRCHRGVWSFLVDAEAGVVRAGSRHGG